MITELDSGGRGLTIVLDADPGVARALLLLLQLDLLRLVKHSAVD